MVPRRPEQDYAEALPLWTPNAAFAQVMNAGSTSLPALESFLNRIMARAAGRIADPAIRRAIGLFIVQETNHHREHRRFNEVLEARYPGLTQFTRQLEADYAAMLRNDSLEDNVAYCEGFESLGIIHGAFFFERADDLLAGADPRVLRLWQWHLAEEFEHRMVCYDVHHALGSGYRQRIKGLLRAIRHLSAYGKAVSSHMLAVDRLGMTEAERRRSLRQERIVRRRQALFMLPRMLALFSPFYSPARKRPLRGADALLATIPQQPQAVRPA